MDTYTFEVATEFNFPNITIYKKIKNGTEHTAWRINVNEGYVMYDTRRNDIEIDPETGEEYPVTYYYTVSSVPLSFDFVNFPWVAVPRDSVDENLIFGLPEYEHEVM